MALAIASGVPPQHGVYTAIIAGIFIALTGGSKVNISGPTAAFVFVLLPIVQQFGLGGLLVSGLMAGIILITLGFVTAFGTFGNNVSALVAGLGLTGLVLGFALKDTISNLLSGVLILLYRPFKIGDTINISGFEGNIVSIDLRYTELNCEGNKTLIPNSKLFADPITVINIVDSNNTEPMEKDS